MFTGIIEELGTVNSLLRKDNSAQLEIASDICHSDSKTGDSISVNGCCLTIVKVRESGLIFDISQETLIKSNLADLLQGDKVNMERPLKQNGRLGGHFVTGHIDYAGRILSKSAKGDFFELKIEIARGLDCFFAKKGSVAVDGISLTVNNIHDSSFTVMIIPHTLRSTTLVAKGEGLRVNIETDIISKYVYNMITKNPHMQHANSGLDKDFLSRHGFA
jgi:riboflavin synthase